MTRAWRAVTAAWLVALPVAVIGRQAQAPAGPDRAKEVHLANVKQLTFGGENAEAYFSFDGQDLIFQSTRDGRECDQIYAMRIDGSNVRRLSNGEGRTTCSFFYPDKKHVLYASTFLGGKSCPAKPDFSRGYVWPVYDSYDIFRANADGTGIERLTTTPGYDAEATISRDGRIVFTSVRDGDMEIYSMNGDGTNVRRLTNRPGRRRSVLRRMARRSCSADVRWRLGPELDDYKALLREGLWRPTSLEIFVMDADGGNLKQVTSLAGASFAPYFTPDGRRIIFASNYEDPKKRDFELYLVNVDGSGLERVTYNPTFDGFPMFSPDGTHLVFASNRNDAKPGETNVFVADWRP